MAILEKDPRDFAYVALYLAIIWHRQIEPEQAWRLTHGKSFMKPGRELNPEMLENIKYHINNGMSYENIEKRFRVNRYDVFSELEKQNMKAGIVNERRISIKK